MKKFDKLYKLTRTGALQYWDISVDGNEIRIEFGQVGTLSPQIAKETISVGMNIGKSNETTPEQQALSEATSKWTKQKEQNGYVDSIESAKRGEKTVAFPEPMLAHSYDKQGHKIKFPAIAQPKLDGIRVLAEKDIDHSVTLFSRKGKVFTSMPHIKKWLEPCHWFLPGMVLDGEAYNHEFHDNFEHITHLVKQVVPAEDHQDVEFHIFDVIAPGGFAHRFKKLRKDESKSFSVLSSPSPIVFVEEKEVSCLQDIEDAYDEFAEAGYEGVMLRNRESPYEHSRSYGLQKYKKFIDEEFEIVDVEEGRGRMAGHGIFVCKTKDGNNFKAKMKGEIALLKKYIENKSDYVGKQLTVQYQGISSKNNVPRFPIGKSIRDYE